MSLVVAEAEPFEPGEDEVAAARAKAKARQPDRILLRVSAAEFGPQLVEELKSLFGSFPGDCEVVLEMETREGTRRLRFGRDYCVTPSQALRAELDQLLGPGRWLPDKRRSRPAGASRLSTCRSSNEERGACTPASAGSAAPSATGWWTLVVASSFAAATSTATSIR